MKQEELEVLLLATQKCTATGNDIVIATGIADEITLKSNPTSLQGDSRVYRKRTGLHLRLPNTYVNRSESLLFCQRLVKLLNQESPSNQWNNVIDTEVYGVPSGGLRMLGSRKVTKGLDKGRVYTTISTFHAKDDSKEFDSQEGIRESKIEWGIPYSLAPTYEKVVDVCSIHKYLND